MTRPRFQFRRPRPTKAPSRCCRISKTRFWLSGQANFVFQTHPDFYAPYSGAHSLRPGYEKATSRLLTLYGGVRVDHSSEILVDIEEAGGAALSTGFGMAGAPDLDIVRNPLLSKAPYLARAMIYTVFSLSKDKVEGERNVLSLFDELPRRRLELRFGKLSMPDFFDINSVGSDTSFQFLHWTTDNNGAWDYAADTRGYTAGLTADYEDRNWGIRFAEALMPKVANGIDLAWRPWQVHAENFEYDSVADSFRRKPAFCACWPTPTPPTWGYTAIKLVKRRNKIPLPTSPPTPGTSRASTVSESTVSRI